MNDIHWSPKVYKAFLENVYLTKFQRKVLDGRLDEKTRTELIDELHCSYSKLDRAISDIRQKYDEAQACDERLPKRYISEKEKYMDEN